MCHWRDRLNREGAVGRPGSQETSLRPQSRYALAERGGPLASNSHRLHDWSVALARSAGSSVSASARDPAVRLRPRRRRGLDAAPLRHWSTPPAPRRSSGRACPGSTAAGALDAATAGELDRHLLQLAQGLRGQRDPRRGPDDNNFWSCGSTAAARRPGPALRHLHSGDHVLWFDCQSGPAPRLTAPTTRSRSGPGHRARWSSRDGLGRPAGRQRQQRPGRRRGGQRRRSGRADSAPGRRPCPDATGPIAAPCSAPARRRLTRPSCACTPAAPRSADRSGERAAGARDRDPPTRGVRRSRASHAARHRWP